MPATLDAYDKIRLLRRKLAIAREEISRIPQGSQRDAATVRAAKLTEELADAVQDFADRGFEEVVAQLLAELSQD